MAAATAEPSAFPADFVSPWLPMESLPDQARVQEDSGGGGIVCQIDGYIWLNLGNETF